MRAGAYGLVLLSDPLNVHVLTSLADSPRALVDLRRMVGAPPQTTMREHLRALTQTGVLERRRRPSFPSSVDYQLTRSGEALLGVLRVLQVWLGASPDAPLEAGTMPAKSAVKAIAEGWSSKVIRAMAAKPLTLTELSRLISDVNYPSLERRLAAMRLTGQIKACERADRGTPYKVTAWTRKASAPLVASARWEREHARSLSTSISKIDVEAAFLLAMPLLKLPADLSGTCRLVTELRNGQNGQRLGGVLARVAEGQIASCATRLEGEASAWASGPVPAWLSAIIDDETDALEIGGDSQLAKTILDRLHSGSVAAGQRA